MQEILLQIREIRKQRELFEKREESLIAGLTKKQDINSIYRSFLELKKVDKLSDSKDKRMFVFVCALLCCPTIILGDRLKKGVRCKIARVTGLHESAISHTINKSLFFYNKYKDFKEEIDSLISGISGD